MIITNDLSFVPTHVPPKLISCDQNGVEKDSFADEPIYIKCTDLTPDSDITIYIVNNTEWYNGKKITSYIKLINATSNNEGEFFGAIWSNPEEGSYDIVVDANRDCYYNVSIDAVDNVSAEPGVTATVTSTQILVNNLEFGDVIGNESVYYYITLEGAANISEGENATGIIPFATIEGGGTVQISIGDNKTLPQNATIYLDDDTVINEDDQSIVVIRGNSNNEAEIISNNTITAENIYAFLKTGNKGEFAVDVVLTIS